MSPLEIRDAVFNRLFSNLSSINANWSTTNVAVPNVDFNPENDAYDGEWIRLAIRYGSTFEGEKGTKGVGIRTGVIMISTFTSGGTGTRKAATYASRVETLFGAQLVGANVMCQQAESNEQGNDLNGYYHILTSIPFNTFVHE